MDDLDVLARDFGLGARGKSNPMRSAPSDRGGPVEDQLFSDVFRGHPKYMPSSNSNTNNKSSSVGDFDYDSIFNSRTAAAATVREPKSSNVSTNAPSSAPVYDKPVYDDDMFDGVPGLKSKSPASTMRFDDDDDVFATISSPSTGKSRNQSNGFDDMLGNFGGNEKPGESNRSSSAKISSSTKGFDDLLAGFGSASSAASNRPTPESRWGSVPTGSKHHNILDDPFVVLESDSTPNTSSGAFTDPLEEIGNFSKSRSARAEVSYANGGAFDDLDRLGTPGRDGRGKDGSPRSAMPQSATIREPMENSSFGYSEINTVKKDSADHFEERPLFDEPNVSTNSQKSFGQTASPQYYETFPQVDMSTTSEGHIHHQSDDVWLTVSEIPLFTQPTAAPPPSRPPPPIPRPSSRSETGSYFSSSRKKGDEVSSPSYYPQHSKSPKPDLSSDKSPPVSQFDELDDFATGRSQNSVDESTNPHCGVDTSSFSAAAAMKDAMDNAEAKFRHAKEVREREHAKAARNMDSGPMEKGESNIQEREFKETQEREKKQKEEEEREMRRIERERLRDIEREKGRHAVERATREARERAAAEARERQAAEARLKAGRTAVDKANAEARERAERAAVQRVQAEARERAAVQRVQAEARERAAAEAKERAGKVAAEARERASTETREKETRDRAAVARAESEARRRAERAATEARERAAVDAKERAAAAASKVNNLKKDDDLESFFSMGRASSAPRDRTNLSNPFSDKQFSNKGGSEAAKRTPSASGATSNMKKASSTTTNFADDLSSIFGGPSSAGEFHDVEGETEERRRARLDRHQRTQERAAKALAEKNQRDLQAQRDQEERNRISETLDIEIRRWSAGKEGNLRALLSTMQYVLWPECGWQPVSLTDLITGASVKKAYRKATLCIHPDKVQQKGATLQQKYIAEKVFDLLKEAWNKLNSEELF